MAALEHHLKLARSLPKRLQRFLAVNNIQRVSQPASETAIGANSDDSQAPEAATSQHLNNPLNPFKPNRNPRTGRWHPPLYSLRRQAALMKDAKEHGVEELLPHSLKSTRERQKRREEHGLRVQGTGVGQRVKGHHWERTLKGRLEKRRQAMLEMPQMIEDWRQVVPLLEACHISN